MDSAGTKSRTKGRLNIPDVEPRFGSTKRAAIRGALTLAVLSALLLIAARPALAQTENVLYNFTGTLNGAAPESALTPDGQGNFYGTTWGGGNIGYGTVFELSPNGSGGWNPPVTIYSFCSQSGCSDGSNPTYAGVIFDSAGNLYGTACSGGANGQDVPSTCVEGSNGYGVVFELSPEPGGGCPGGSNSGNGWCETVLYSFCSQSGCSDGTYPNGSLIFDTAGNLYGVTWDVVFELSPSNSGWTEQPIYSGYISLAGPNGEGPATGLTIDPSGNIFGFGSYNIAFELSPNGSGGWTSSVIHTFGGPKDGSNPAGAPVLDSAGNIYGAAYNGGEHAWGAVFKLTPVTSGREEGTYKEKLLYSFKGGRGDGADPYAGIVLDTAGNIYGTTYRFGDYGYGNAWELVAPAYHEKVLWNFNYADGAFPESSLVMDSEDNLYGTAVYSLTGFGVVYEITPSGTATTTTTTLTSSLNPSISGEAVTFTAVVTPAPLDGETITFKHGSRVLGTGVLSGGSASFTTSTLSLGITTVQAVYSGDGDYDASKSNTVKQVVKE